MDDFLPISALQHFAYCPRQFALIHVEQAWEENRFTAEGHNLHERVDSGVSEHRRRIYYERGVLLRSEQLRLVGKMDLLEVAPGPIFYPVEYKRGQSKIEDWDRIQLCAQALCLEEMRQTDITEGAIWYWKTRQREPVALDLALRQITLDCIQQALHILDSGLTPAPTAQVSRCKACSLQPLCRPDQFRKDTSASYVQRLFEP